MDKIKEWTQIFYDISTQEWEKVIEYFKKNPDNMMFPLNINRDNVFHLAVYSKRDEPFITLQEIFTKSSSFEKDSKFLFLSRNERGNTILHEAVSVGNLEVVKVLVKDYRELIMIENGLGEYPLYTAAAFGQTQIIKHFAGVERFVDIMSKSEIRKVDKKSIIQVAVEGEHFETALVLSNLLIELNKRHLIGQLKDKKGVSALDCLATMPSAFKSGQNLTAFESFLYSWLPFHDDTTTTDFFKNHTTTNASDARCFLTQHLDLENCMPSCPKHEKRRFGISSYSQVVKGMKQSIWKLIGGPQMEKIWNERKRHKFAMELASLLIKETIWENEFEVTPSENRDNSSKKGDSEGSEVEENEIEGNPNEKEEKNHSKPNPSHKKDHSTLKQEPHKDKSKGTPPIKNKEISSEEEDQMETDDDYGKYNKQSERKGHSTLKQDPHSHRDSDEEVRIKMDDDYEKYKPSQRKGHSTSKQVPQRDSDEEDQMNDDYSNLKQQPQRDSDEEDDDLRKENPSQKITGHSKSEQGIRKVGDKIDGTTNIPSPLFMATKMGIIEIVHELIIQYPQAIEHLDRKGQNILHVAVSYRRKEIFNMLQRMQIPWMRMTQVIDDRGYTLLHKVSEKKHYTTGATRPGPALQLQEELLWFDRVEKVIPSYYAKHHENTNNLTPVELFEIKHKDDLENAQKWAKDTSQSCSTVAVLVATVVFAAAYTVPGGTNDKGFPNLLDSPYFLFFTVMDVISLACSLTSVVAFLSILTSPFEFEDFRRSIPRKLIFGFTLLFFSVITTMLAFGSTILLVIRKEKQLTASLISVAAFFPVSVFAFLQFRLYGTMIKDFLSLMSKFLPCLAFLSASRHHRLY